MIDGISSDYIRTKESLQLILAGLFPPTKQLTWLTGLKWIPIATETEKKTEDKVIT